MEFADGGKKIGKLEHLGKTNRTGSTVRFKPDPRIFSTTEYKYDVVCERAREEAFLLSGIAMVVSDKRNKKNETETYLYEDGLIAFLGYLHEDRNVLMNPVKFSGEANGIQVEAAFQYTDDYQENTYSFVNLVRTGDGGTPVFVSERNSMAALNGDQVRVQFMARRQNHIKEAMVIAILQRKKDNLSLLRSKVF